MIHIERIVNRIFTSNTYVISCDESNSIWLVDVGDIEKVIDILPKDSIVRGVFLTHTHFDHIYGINELYDRFPNLQVYVGENGIEALYSAKLNLSLYHESPLSYKGEKVMGVKEGDAINLFPQHIIRALSTPGHTPDSVSFLLDDKYLFTGDAFIPNSKVVSKLPGGNKEEAKSSVARIVSIKDGLTVMPGHGEIYYNVKRLFKG